MPLTFEGYETRSTRYQQEFAAPMEDVLGATAEQAFSELPVPSLVRSVSLTRANASADRIDAPTARQRVKDAGLEGRLSIDDAGIAAPALDILVNRKRDEIRRQEILSRAPSGFGPGAARLSTAFVTSLLDPVNVGLAFVPAVGEARYMQYLARAGGVLGRTAVRAGVGAIEGAVGAAIAEPLVLAAKTQEQADYGLQDSLLNVAFGSVFGGGLHVIAGAGGDAWRALRSGETLRAPAGSAAARVAGGSIEAREAALRTAVGQAMEGREVRVEALADDFDPFVPRTIEQRIAKEEDLRTRLIEMREESGWEQKGGQLLRKSNDFNDPDYNVITGRTQWIPRADWWRDRPENLNEADVRTTVDKAIEGKRLSPRERKTVAFMIQVADERKRLAEFLPTDEEMRAEGLDGVDDAHEAAMVARASELDDAVVERLAMEYADDDAGFLTAVKAFLDEHEDKATPQAREADQGAAIDQARQDSDFLTRPESDVTADVRAAAAADEQLAQAPAQGADPVADIEAELADQLAELKDVARIAGVDLDDELAEFDEAIELAETYGKAARAAALCGLGH